MKLDQLQQAQNLYFQTDLTKSEIAKQTGISRRTIHDWANAYEWDRQKKNAEHMPVYIAENCYHIMGHLTEEILSVERQYDPITSAETNNLYKLTLTINRLNARATLNEGMEALLRFSDSVANEDPEFASKMQPWIDKFIAAQAVPQHTKNRPSRMNYKGLIPRKDLAIEAKEEEIDMSYFYEWQKQKREKEAAQAKACEPLPKQTEALPNSAPEAPSAPHAENKLEAKSCATSPSPLGEGRGEASCPTPPIQDNLQPDAAPQKVAEAPKTMADLLRAQELAKPKPDLRKLLRGTSTTGPSKILRRPLAA